jgi:hypothetical protein
METEDLLCTEIVLGALEGRGPSHASILKDLYNESKGATII